MFTHLSNHSSLSTCVGTGDNVAAPGPFSRNIADTRSPSLPVIDVAILSPLPGTITCYELRSQAESSHVEDDNLEKRDSSAPTPHDTTMILYTEFSISSTLANSARSDLILTSRMIYGYEHYTGCGLR